MLESSTNGAEAGLAAAGREDERDVGERDSGRRARRAGGGAGPRAGRAREAPAVHGGVQAADPAKADACTRPGESGRCCVVRGCTRRI